MPQTPWMYAPGSEGGVGHGFSRSSTTATFVYMTHSAVVSCFESANLRPKGRMLAGDVSDPPQNRGVMRSRTDGIWDMPLCRTPWGRSRPHLSLREGSETAAIGGAESTETEL